MEQEDQVAAVKSEIESITNQIEEAKQMVQQWADAATNLSLNAAEARANNQSKGRGIGGALLGAKFRAAMRKDAAASNARIAKEVAEKRIAIAEGKRSAQDMVKQLQAQLTEPSCLCSR